MKTLITIAFAAAFAVASFGAFAEDVQETDETGVSPALWLNLESDIF